MSRESTVWQHEGLLKELNQTIIHLRKEQGATNKTLKKEKANLKKELAKWEYEAVERGKDIEKVISFYTKCRGVLPEGYTDTMDAILNPYIDRNTAACDKGKADE